jgi:glycosyltransferase involved in cell wall biosynthesis
MKIAFFTNYTELYGANRSLINLISGLYNFGHKAIIFSPEQGQITDYLKDKGIDNYIVPFPISFTNYLSNEQIILQRITNTVNCIPLIVDICTRNQVELIYSNSSVFDIGLIISKIINKPHIWHFREFGDLDYQLFPDFGKEIFRRLIKFSDGLIFISKALKNYYLGGNVNNKVIYNGIISSDDLKQNYLIWLDKRIKPIMSFIIVGLVRPSKGQDKAVFAFKEVIRKYPDSVLEIVGGIQLEWIKKIVIDNNLESNVRILGEVHNPFEYYLKSDAALMCSPNEAMGRVTLEAMASGIPVIGYNSAATPELITNGFNGLLYDGSIKDLSNKMVYLIEHPLEARQMGLNGINDIKSNYTIENYSEQINYYISSIVSNFGNNKPVKNYIDDSGLNQFEKNIVDIYNQLFYSSIKKESVKNKTSNTSILNNIKNNLPKISIVTPSLNQSKYLDECIDSILSQNYPNLEYLIMDGGSNDGSIEIIKKYEKYLTYWQCKPDDGQYNSIQAGLNKSTGEIMTWLNSDDKFHPNSLFKVANLFESHPSVEWICGRPTYLDHEGRLIGIYESIPVWKREDFLKKKYDDPFIQQESTFWKRSLWKKAGGYLDPKYNLAGDLELWIRFFRYADLFSFNALIGGWRKHDDQKSSSQRSMYISQAEAIIENEVKYFNNISRRNSNNQNAVIKYDFKLLKNSALNFSIIRGENCWRNYQEDITKISIQAAQNNKTEIISLLKSEFEYPFDPAETYLNITDPNLTVPEKQHLMQRLINEAEKYIIEDKYLQALSILNVILKQEPNYVDALNDYAVVELKRNNSDTAKKILEVVLKLDNNNLTAAKNLFYLKNQIEDSNNYINGKNSISMPTISVITPSFNQGKFIGETIQSVLNQNYPNFEHIIIDGGSSDGTIEILKRYPHLKWISEKDKGQSDAINKGIGLAAGEIIAWINSDDWYEPNTFIAVAKFFEENQYKNIVMGNCNLVDENGKFIECVINVERGFEELKNYRVARSIPTQPAIFFRKKLLEESGLLDINLRYVMDYDLWMRFAKKDRFFYVNQTFANYRFHKEAKIGDSNWEKIYPECEIVKQRYVSFGDSPLVSIIVPCYNYAKYLPEAVESVVNQSYSNWEIIIVNDGSIDNTIETAMQLISSNLGKKIKLINQENSGKPSISRNCGIEESNGTYILPLDADDKLTPDAISRYIDAAGKSQTENIVLFGWLRTFGITSNLWQTREFQLIELLHTTMLPYCSMFHRSVWQKNNGYATNVGYEDWDFWIGAAEKGTVFINVPLVTTLRRETRNNSRQKIDRKKHELNIAGIVINHKVVFEDDEIKWAEDYLINCSKSSNGAAHQAAKEKFPVITASLIHHYPDLYEKQETEWAKNILAKELLVIRKGFKNNISNKKNNSLNENWIMNKVNLAIDNLKNSKNAEAIQNFDDVLKILPELTEVKYGKAVALANLGNVRKATNELEELLKAKPDYYAAKDLLLKLYSKN